MALAAQAYAKSELLWYFRHVAEKLPGASAAAGSGASKLGLPLLAEKPSGPQLTEDAHVVTLVAATTAVYDLLVSERHVKDLLVACKMGGCLWSCACTIWCLVSCLRITVGSRTCF